MEFSIFGVKLEVILLLILLFLIFSHTCCSCSTISARDGIVLGLKTLNHVQRNFLDWQNKQEQNYMLNPVAQGPYKKSMFEGMMDYDMIARVTGKSKDGFSNMTSGPNFNDLALYSKINTKPISTSSWFTPDLTYSQNGSMGKGVQNILNRKSQPIPLPEGELSMFATTPFKPECCPNTFSNSSGCACMTVPQYDYLINRGGNNVPYSEY